MRICALQIMRRNRGRKNASKNCPQTKVARYIADSGSLTNLHDILETLSVQTSKTIEICQIAKRQDWSKS
jgi:hypothetical protein